MPVGIGPSIAWAAQAIAPDSTPTAIAVLFMAISKKGGFEPLKVAAGAGYLEVIANA
jgi:hypothetical protein